MSRIVVFNKPYRVISQFSAQGDKQTLADFIPVKDVYAAGRLDYESEGLMLLTDDGKLQASITDPKNKKYKTYVVQLEGQIDRRALVRLQRGVDLKEGRTMAARVKTIQQPGFLWERDPPVRFRRNSPTSWIEIQIREGKNRQVRRMTAAVGFPALRLIRTKIDQWELESLKPGDYRIVDLE